MLKRFVMAALTFVGLVVPATFVMALLLAPPARPATFRPPGCVRNLQEAGAEAAAAHARLRSVGESRNDQACKLTRLYFLKLVTARAVTAMCERSPHRERALGQLDADVTHINNSIAVACN